VSRIFVSWNQLDGWLRQVDGLRRSQSVLFLPVELLGVAEYRVGRHRLRGGGARNRRCHLAGAVTHAFVTTVFRASISLIPLSCSRRTATKCRLERIRSRRYWRRFWL
jgi:hypothetical protein